MDDSVNIEKLKKGQYAIYRTAMINDPAYPEEEYNESLRAGLLKVYDDTDEFLLECTKLEKNNSFYRAFMIGDMVKVNLEAKIVSP